MITKLCARCGQHRQIWPASEFYRNRAREDGFANWCRYCMREDASARYQRQTAGLDIQRRKSRRRDDEPPEQEARKAIVRRQSLFHVPCPRPSAEVVYQPCQWRKMWDPSLRDQLHDEYEELLRPPEVKSLLTGKRLDV